MLINAKRMYRLAEFTVERGPKGWFFAKAATFDDKPEWRGPYGIVASVTLVIARELKKEIGKRDAPCNID